MLILLLIFSFSCSREEESLYAENVEPVSNDNIYTGPTDYLTDLGTININVLANGNHPGKNDPAFIKNINAPNVGYCHPDVQYFQDGLNGYKYWMVFTPYFGTIGIAKDARRYENPTIVVSNDGLNWSPPPGMDNPLQKTPSINESFSDKKEEMKQGFWSDVDWTFEKGKFSLYYRGSFIKATAIKKEVLKARIIFEKGKKMPSVRL
uniref:Uncharacterized protein n=1 Tax=Chryseobacterium endophyticum TaxID=1854762 RepID=A0AAU6WNH0_9FLAO